MVLNGKLNAQRNQQQSQDPTIIHTKKKKKNIYISLRKNKFTNKRFLPIYTSEKVFNQEIESNKKQQTIIIIKTTTTTATRTRITDSSSKALRKHPRLSINKQFVILFCFLLNIYISFFAMSNVIHGNIIIIKLLNISIACRQPNI